MIILLQHVEGLIPGDLLPFHFQPDSILQISNYSDLKNMFDTLQKEMARQTMINDVILLYTFEKCCFEESQVAFFSVGEASQNRRCIMKGPDKLYFRDIEMPRSLHEHLTRNTAVAQSLTYLFSNL